MTKTINSLQEATEALYAFIPPAGSPKGTYELTRIAQLAALLGNPQNDRPVIHIAGTSGKTSTCYYIAALLREANQKTGLTVSPHIVSITERFQIDMQPVSDRSFIGALQEFLSLVEATDVRLSYFEILVMFAYWLFAKSAVDYEVIETGLGGLLDGTNIVSSANKICVISDLGLDHTEILGNTIEKIAYQKAGIIQPGNEVFIVEQSPEAMKVVEDYAASKSATVHIVSVPSDDATLDGIPSFQRRNWALARAVYSLLIKRDGLPELSAESLSKAQKVRAPGRMERYQYGRKQIILDGAHNPQKMAALRAAIQSETQTRHDTQTTSSAGIAVLANFIAAPEEKVLSTLKELLPITDHLIIPEFHLIQDLSRRSIDSAHMARYATSIGFESVEICKDAPEALQILLHRPESTLLVTGSLYLVSQVRPLVIADAQPIAASG